ncbi:MAG TPA: response regulator [Planctomycetota bacterium]
MNELLLIEDDETDVLFFERALAEAGGGVLLQVAEDAEEAVSRLRRPGPPPALVVLDLVLRRGSGLEILEWLRREPALKDVPVVVLTSSRNPAELARARELGVQRVEIKPAGFAELRALVGAILEGIW